MFNHYDHFEHYKLKDEPVFPSVFRIVLIFFIINESKSIDYFSALPNIFLAT